VSAVACLGDCCLDVYVEPVARVLVGGSCLNVAVGLARHGVEAVYAGPIGDDAAGEHVLALLAEHGLAAGRVRRVAGARTAVTDILLEPGGERRFLREDYAVQEDYAPSEADWEWLARTGAVHSSRMPAQLGRLRALGSAGARVSYDFTTDPVPAQLAGLDVAFVPDEALAGQAPAEAARTLVTRGAACAVVTQGERGAVAATPAGVEHVAAVPVERVVDTCGAGDAFMAAFLARRLAGAPLRACLEAGAADGAAACLHLGAIEQAGYPLEARA
jgi:fructoselysine 6-kinase